MGNLLPHRIRQVRQGGQTKQAGPLIEEMSPPAVIPSCQPEYRIRHEPPEAEFPEYLLAEFSMKGLVRWRACLFFTDCKAHQEHCYEGQMQVKI
jgi:hypothetical protein